MTTTGDNRAELTIVSGKTGMHVSINLTGRINDGGVWRDESFDHAHVVFANRPGKRGTAGKIGRLRPRSKEWIWDASATPAEKWVAQAAIRYITDGSHPENGTFLEAVPCSRCGETLYDPVSIIKGIGPTCNQQATKSRAVPSGTADDHEAILMRAEMAANGIPGY